MSAVMSSVASQIHRLKDLAFSDLFLEPSGEAWSKRSPDDHERSVLAGSLLEEADLLRARLQEHRTGMDFRVDWEHGGGHALRMRVQRMETVDGDVYICRRLRDSPLPFKELGFPPGLMAALLGDGFAKGGLILFTGATGAGKSTSLASWLAARLARYGGTAWTVENPVETTLAGRYGHDSVVGTCYQTEVREDAEFGTAIQRMLRAAPNIIMVGEIRNKEAASQTMVAGTSGHLVASTLHANDITGGLERIKGLVKDGGLDSLYLSEALAAIIHQSVSTQRLGEKERRVMNVTPLIVAGSRNATAIRSHLRTGEFTQLTSEIERQRRILANLGGEAQV